MKSILATKNLVAIDLSGYNLKIAQMGFSAARREILNLATHDVRNLSEDDIAKIIRETLKEFQIVKPKVLAVIPSFLTITKNIEIPSRDPQEIREIINLQASRHTPYSRDEIIIDYIDIGVYKQSYSKVLLVIVTRSLIRRQLEILDRAGLVVERMAFAPEGVSYILSKSLRLTSQEFPAGVIHIDEGFTDFMIIWKDEVIFIRNIPIGTQHFLGEIEKYESKFVEEVRKSLEAYASEDIEGTPSRFFLTGAIDSLRYLTDKLNDALHISIKSLLYFDYLSLSQRAMKIGSLNSNRLSFLNTITCLLSWDEMKLDLLPDETKLEKAVQRRAREIIKTGILIMTVFILIYCILIGKIYLESSYLKEISSRYDSIHKEAQKLEANFTNNRMVRNLLSGRGYSLEVLIEFYKALPLSIQISFIKFDAKGTFSVEGTGESMAAVFSFVDNLGESFYFRKVETRYTRKRKQAQKDLTDFALICTLNKEIE